MTYFIFQNISYILWLVRPTNRSFQDDLIDREDFYLPVKCCDGLAAISCRWRIL